MSRKWIYDVLNTVGDFAGNVLQGESLLTGKIPPPFAIYRMGNDTNEALWDDYPDNPNAGRQFFQVYIHDKPADYARIDDLKDAVIEAFKAAVLPAGVVAVRYLETSRDLDDGTLGTIYRYLRFQLVRAG
jgi:hypothetical protein